MARFPWKLVTVDIDDTLTTVHGWRTIAHAAGRLPAYEAESRRIRNDGIDEDAHLKVLFGFATGLDRPRLDAALAGTPRVAHIAATVQAIRARGARCSLLTHNPDYVIAWYDRRFGFEGGSGGWGSKLRQGVVRPPNGVRADKVRGLSLLRRRFRVRASEVVHVGDAWPDARLAPLLGGFVAFNPRSADVAAAADAVVRSRDLASLLPVLERLAPRSVVKGARPLP